MLKVVDLSNNNFDANGVLSPNCETAYREADALIMKATQGTYFVDRYCDKMVQRAIKDGKLWGFYHYAGGGNPIAEAVYFYNNCKNYFKHGIPVIDFEEADNASNWNNHNWVRQFVNKVHELSGVWCMVYIQQSALAKVANCANDCALWVAAYPTLTNNSWNAGGLIGGTAPWATYTLWQYTAANGCDRSMGNLTRDGWNRIAGAVPSKPVVSKPAPGAQYRVYVVRSGDTLSGVFGNDWPRVAKLNNLPNPNLIYPGQKLKY